MNPLDQLIAEEAAATERLRDAEAHQSAVEALLSEARAATLSARTTAGRAKLARCFAEAVAEMHGFEVPNHLLTQTYAIKAIEGRWVRIVHFTRRQIGDTWAGCFAPFTTDRFVDRTTGLEKGTRSSQWRQATPPIPLDILNREVAAFEARAGGGA